MVKFLHIMRLQMLFILLSLSLLNTKNIYAQSKDTLSIIGVGDIMLGTSYPDSKYGEYLPAKKGAPLFSNVKHILQKGDIVFGNLEGCILNYGGTPKKCKDTNNCYLFRMPEYVVDYLKDAGFNMLNLANNHANDFGTIGLTNTHRVLTMANIHTAGLKNICEYSLFEKDNIRYGFLGVSPNIGTIHINDYNTIKKIIHHLDTMSDIIIVSFHGGAEGEKYNRIDRKKELFLGEDRGNVYELAHLCIDWGADVILGHGPHVPRAIELYKDRIIAYSLGNFCTPFRISLTGSCGYAPILNVNINKQGEFLSGEIISALQYKGIGTKIDTTHKAAKQIARLTKLDFPESKLLISEDGKIIKK